MKLLLDTHVFVWWTLADSRIRESWVEAIVDPVNTVYVSAATAWEIETKKRLGKLRFSYTVDELVPQFGFSPLSITVAHATRSGLLEWEHKDPFDRMLVAQSTSEGLAMVTADEAVVTAPGIRVLP